MEARKITIVETKNQKKSAIMSEATTLAELKSDLTANGIDYDDMAFYEGVSKTELKSDNSVLPHDIPYKGTITNELVFMLTNTNKKIRSGAVTYSRAEAYSAIKSMGLQDACVKKLGKNYTMCKTADLIVLIQDAESLDEDAPVNTVKTYAIVAPADNAGCVDAVARDAVKELVEILYHKFVIDKEDREKVLNILTGIVPASPKKPELASPYSDDDIDDMLSEMNIY